ncbi:MAG: outer membrane lipoprotein carrier protein LolA [Candidatus Hydrogenedentales bacterium]
MLSALVFICAGLAQAPDELDKFVQSFSEKRDDIVSLRAPFTQRTVTPEEILTSHGEVVYMRPKRLLFRYTEPEQVYMLENLRAYEYDPELRQLQIFDLEEQPQTAALFLGFEEDIARLRDAYDLRLLIAADSDTPVAFEIVPKPDDADAEAYFERVIVYLRPQDYLPEELHIINSAESQTIIRFEDYRINEQMDETDVQLYAAPGTDVIVNEEFIERVEEPGKRFPTETAKPAAAPDAE